MAFGGFWGFLEDLLGVFGGFWGFLEDLLGVLLVCGDYMSLWMSFEDIGWVFEGFFIGGH